MFGLISLNRIEMKYTVYRYNLPNQINWRPIFIIVQFVIVLWRELNCVKIPQGEANKSANR
jgi:hypothetical protein